VTVDRIIVRRDAYFDSVFLMSLSAELTETDGLQVGQVVLGTPANKQLLGGQGFDQAVLEPLGPTDLIVALRAASETILSAAEKRFDELLIRRKSGSGEAEAERPIGLDGALRARPEANLVVVSVPGAYAAYEARRAIQAGLHVMLFSDNVSVEDEIALKQEAVRRGLLMMGPDCGTAILNGAMLGFANAVRPGPIGLVGASGTGTQEVTCLIHKLGSGITQAIGTGGRDLSEAVGARTTLFAIDALAADPATRVVVVVSKPPAEKVAAKVLDRLAKLGKPSVVHFVGAGRSDKVGSVHHAPDLASAARMAVQLAQGKPVAAERSPLPMDLVSKARKAKTSKQVALRGLFTGGTMGAEALAHLQKYLGKIPSNLGHGSPPADVVLPDQHAIIDLGGDEFTQGRPHPMIDPTPRAERLMAEAENDRLAVVLLDVVLGTGSHADPAGAMLPSIRQTQERAKARGQHVTVVTSVTGTDGDSQGLEGQIAKLQRAGVVVLPSNMDAVRFAHAVIDEAIDG
jgi:succinyl-CoA synthetase alpha subunit